MSDTVNHPPHYIGTNGIEVIDVIEGFGLGHHLGAAIAYILRADRNIAREIANRERALSSSFVTVEEATRALKEMTRLRAKRKSGGSKQKGRRDADR